MSRDDAPVRISYEPASTFHPFSRSSQNAKARGSRVIEIGLVSPGPSETRANPLSSRGGRGTEAFGGATYTWTISSPATLPVLVTSRAIAAEPSGWADARKWAYSNVV